MGIPSPMGSRMGSPSRQAVRLTTVAHSFAGMLAEDDAFAIQRDPAETRLVSALDIRRGDAAIGEAAAASCRLQCAASPTGGGAGGLRLQQRLQVPSGPGGHLQRRRQQRSGSSNNTRSA